MEEVLDTVPSESADEIPTSFHGFVRVMAVACGITVGNMYYNQPLLPMMARTFHVTVRGVGFIPTLTQLGYAAGMLLIVPLGDILPRRRLIITLLLIVSLMLTAAAVATSLPWLALASFAIGFTTVTPQILIPMAAHLSPVNERGKSVGTVMMGLLLGILLSRTVSGFIGDWFGWRIMYGAAAVMMVALAAVLGPLLPAHDAPSKLTYRELLRSVIGLVRKETTLRQSMLNGALLFGAFSAFWATLAFRLEAAPLHYGARAAGMFGIVGAVGAFVAPLVGKWSDRIGPRSILTICILSMLAAYGVFWGLGTTLFGLGLGVILLDAATQGGIVANQSRIYRLSHDAHSRVNSAFMVAYFIGGAAGSMVGTWAWSIGKWNGVCVVGMALPVLALVGHGMARRPPETLAPTLADHTAQLQP
jgi:predicted MFS family arabinose efflux permease